MENELLIGNQQASGSASSSLRILMLGFGFLLASIMSQATVAGVILNEPILGGSLLVATDGTVTVEFLGSDAGYFSTLYLDLGETGPDELDLWIFDKSLLFASPDKRIVSLPGEFAAGSELVFRLDVRKNQNAAIMYSYFTGDQSRNPDGIAHAEAITIFDELSSDYLTTVRFEDLFGGGDSDFNDFSFQLTNVVDPPPVPTPSILALLGIGLAGIRYLRQKPVNLA